MIEVRDSLNPERLLGTFAHKPFPKLNEKYYRMMAAELPRSAWGFDPNTPIMPAYSCWQVEFIVSYRRSDDGYSMTAELHTYAPLNQLMMIEHFRLPGETEEAWGRRRYPW